MKKNHKIFANLAFNLAEINLGNTKKNPSVGCVIVKNNCVISSGVTSVNGRPHAEYNALKKKIDYTESNMYVTLEPCTHYGKTPPCTNIINKRKIKKVYYCYNDPDKRTFRKAKRILRIKKIKLVKINSFEKNNFYKSYFLNKINQKILIDAKIAISKDFFTMNKKSKWITNWRSQKVAHLIRSKYDCIISTSKTINKDDSLLNCRIEGLNNYKPDLFILDLNLKLKKKLLLNNIINKRKTFLITNVINKKKTIFFKKKGYKIIFIKDLRTKKDFNIFFQKIYKLGYRRAFFETGLTFLNSLFNFKFINNLFIFKSNQKLGNNGLNNSSIKYLKKIKFNKRINVNLNEDSLYKEEF